MVGIHLILTLAVTMLGVHLKELLKSTMKWSGKRVQLMLSTQQHFLGGGQYEEV